MLKNVVQKSGLAVIGAIPWAAFISESKSAPLVLRPPGALDESRFIKTCIRCGMCVESCPYDTLMLAKPGDHKPLGTPHFVPRNIPCYMCEDIPCVVACPSNALNETLVSSAKDGETELDITRARMGVAVVDPKSCIAHWGIQCDACYRSCPLMGSAITIERKRNARTGKHAFLTPVVDNSVCTGCGICERTCITKEASIRVIRKDIVQGEVDTNYIKGWEQDDEMRLLEAADHVTTTTERSKKTPLDYLNTGELTE